jgi:hypothetical protein
METGQQEQVTTGAGFLLGFDNVFTSIFFMVRL